jgi:hypothetical protein
MLIEFILDFRFSQRKVEALERQILSFTIYRAHEPFMICRGFYRLQDLLFKRNLQDYLTVSLKFLEDDEETLASFHGKIQFFSAGVGLFPYSNLPAAPIPGPPAKSDSVLKPALPPQQEEGQLVQIDNQIQLYIYIVRGKKVNFPHASRNHL